MSICSDCGAPLDDGRSCQDYFNELLALESQVPGGPGEVPHFFAVASYNLQHPSRFVPRVLVGLRGAVSDVLAGRTTLAHVRRRTRTATGGSTRVLRRDGLILSADEEAMLNAWPQQWDMTVRDVCGKRPEEYAESVRGWAESVIKSLDRAVSQ